MIDSQNSISPKVAQQILFEAEQNGMAVERYLQKLAARSDKSTKENASKVREASVKVSFAKTHEWLRRHAHEYVGKWVVLENDRLIGFGENPRAIVEKARDEGVEIPFVHFISGNQEPFMGGWL